MIQSPLPRYQSLGLAGVSVRIVFFLKDCFAFVTQYNKWAHSRKIKPLIDHLLEADPETKDMTQMFLQVRVCVIVCVCMCVSE